MSELESLSQVIREGSYSTFGKEPTVMLNPHEIRLVLERFSDAELRGLGLSRGALEDALWRSDASAGVCGLDAWVLAQKKEGI